MHELLHGPGEEGAELSQTQADLVEAIQQTILGHVLENRRLAPEDSRNIVTHSEGELELCLVRESVLLSASLVTQNGETREKAMGGKVHRGTKDGAYLAFKAAMSSGVSYSHFLWECCLVPVVAMMSS